MALAEQARRLRRILANPEALKRDAKRDLRRARRRDEKRAILCERDPLPRHTKGWAD